ncbi:caspase family protein [Oculatella sp. LEGE 06141]|uniref:WD40 domain-containing protein n=1 Tax=Oculatella sp. LEGE 06141 TaxID=1828648 RepID=UPI00187E63EA|nr:caspase family protein [Oculatella sp. LEGE 06141]MBE9180354.1 caspase family protein [Oculatella sp. LEGE 06141]
MVKNWAIAIGVNDYSFLPPLRYATQDAQAMQTFLMDEAGFERIFFFADHSLPINGKSTQPSRANLLRMLRQIFAEPFMEAGDNFWFFFSGHGIRHDDRDYLMPADGDPEDIENTAIAIHYITERLRRCGADNVVLILDACRNQNARTGPGIGNQTAAIARQSGVISIFSCSPNEFSYEIEALEQGIFTYALLEGLGLPGQCATVEGLNQYLTSRIPELAQRHGTARQTPYIIAEPITKQHLILVPRYATPSDIVALKNDAYRAAQIEGNLELSEQLWIRVLAAASGQDMDAVKALQRIAQWRMDNGMLVESAAATPLAVLTQPAPLPLFDASDEATSSNDLPMSLVSSQTAVYPSRPVIQPVPGCVRLLAGHTASVQAIAISADGKLLASGSDDQTARLWNLETGEPLHRFYGHANVVTAVAISPDGKTLVTGSGDNTIKLWDCVTGALVGTLTGHSGWVLAIALSPDGKTLASGSADGSIKLWHLDTHQEQRILQGHLGWVGTVAVSPDGALLASGSHDKTVKLWDLETGRLLNTLVGHTERVCFVAISADAETLISGSHDNTIKLWQLQRGKLLRTFAGHADLVSAIALSPNGKLLASGSHDNTIKLWQLQRGKLLRTFAGHADSVSAIAFSSNGKLLASGSRDRAIRVWQVPSVAAPMKWLFTGAALLLLTLSVLLANQVWDNCQVRSLNPTACVNDHLETVRTWLLKRM